MLLLYCIQKFVIYIIIIMKKRMRHFNICRIRYESLLFISVRFYSFLSVFIRFYMKKFMACGLPPDARLSAVLK